MKALDFMKLICKDFWEEVFKKKVSKFSILPDGLLGDSIFMSFQFCQNRLTGYLRIIRELSSYQIFVLSGSIATLQMIRCRDMLL